MKPNSLITLFAPSPAPPQRGSSSYVVSILAHAAGCAWLLFGLSHTPRIESTPSLRRFTVRVLEAPAITPHLQSPSGSPAAARSASHEAGKEVAANDSPAPMPVAATQMAQPVHQLQTLIQPDAPQDVVLLKKIPVPTVFMWTPVTAPVKPVIQAPLQKPVLSQLRPTLEPPNREIKMADIRLSSSNVATTMKSLAASTTSPIVVRTPDLAQQMPETAAKAGPEPTPVRIMSISEFRQEGPVTIPLANATARPSAMNSTSAGGAVNATDTGHVNTESKQAGVGTGQATGASSNSAASTNKGVAGSGANSQVAANSTNSTKGVTGSGTSSQLGASSAPAQATGIDTGVANLGPVAHITLPQDGQFGVVVVGSSLAEEYPEIVNVWGGRLVYSVYLHVGGGKNWILQYSVPNASGGAGSVRPDAPWPYDIVRPRFEAEDFSSDALLVHGFVNSAGRFERLALVFPTEFAKVKFLLNALQQWEFRPARQNGQAAAVEVLLIIPEQTE
jgi:hypothetical protein